MQSFNPPSGGNQSDSVHVIQRERLDPNEAFAVYSALAKLAVNDPAVGRIPMMRAMRQRAYNAFLESFEVAA